MSRVTFDLAVATHPDWVRTLLDNFDEFLVDHANCERKAAAMAMSFIAKYPEQPHLVAPLVELAREELEHFAQVYELMQARGLRLADDSKDPYVNALLDACRSSGRGRYIDRMLVSSLIETRGAERFRLLVQALEDPELQLFYRALWACEAKHGNVFVKLLLVDEPEEEIYDRLRELNTVEGRIIESIPWRASLH